MRRSASFWPASQRLNGSWSWLSSTNSASSLSSVSSTTGAEKPRSSEGTGSTGTCTKGKVWLGPDQAHGHGDHSGGFFGLTSRRGTGLRQRQGIDAVLGVVDTVRLHPGRARPAVPALELVQPLGQHPG